MPSITMKIPGADFSGKNLGRVLKLTTDRTGLVGEYILGRNAKASAYNGANPDLPALIVGAPVYKASYCTLSRYNYLNTLLLDAAEVTLLAIGSSAGNSSYIGQFGIAGGGATTHLWGDNSGVNGYSTGNTSNVQAASPWSPARGAGFRGLAFRSVGATNFKSVVDQFYSAVRTGKTETTSTQTKLVHPTKTFAIGSPHGGATFAEAVNIAGALIWHKALTDAELLAAYLEARAALAPRGIIC